MARRLTDSESAIQPEFHPGVGRCWEKKYQIELLTPMAGGGTASWKPDFGNPVRTQAIKGQLRFWWRTMQPLPLFTSAQLKAAEDTFWGNTEGASPIRLNVLVNGQAQPVNIGWGGRGDNYLQFRDAGLPGYVLFPLQNSFDPEDECQLIASGLSFTLTVQCPNTAAVIETVKNTVKLWVLFGGLGARTTRGCGSLYCPEIMEDFPDGAAIKRFIDSVTPEGSPDLGSAPWPMLGNCKFGLASIPAANDAQQLWCTYLDQYGEFRQGGTYAREPGTARGRPGRSRWPEPDAIRRITGTFGTHQPRHGHQWFPRAAYGMPIETSFNTRSDPTDPKGKFNLQPAGSPRWPSPFILKVVKLANQTLAKAWLLLNHSLPHDLVLRAAPPYSDYELEGAEHPANYIGKQLLHGRTVPAVGTSPHQALIDYLGIPEVP
ncbi:MAG: type III-B CRISPR module RAMP protein Cmr1 [bacterium]|nr:type III-B CRISPR module RAMP protein Cmr1 [bacterium]